MKPKSNNFWQNYKRNAILAWFFLILTPVIPIILGVLTHFTIGTNPTISFIGECSGLVPFFLFIYFALKFKFAECPHCHQTIAKFKNLIFPIDPVCPKCSKHMDSYDPEPEHISGASGVFDLNSDNEAEAARQKLRSIVGTSVRGIGTQVIVEPEYLRQSIDKMAHEHGWPIQWYTVVQK